LGFIAIKYVDRLPLLQIKIYDQLWFLPLAPNKNLCIFITYKLWPQLSVI